MDHLTIKQCAELCSVTERTVSKWIAIGRLKICESQDSDELRIPLENLLYFMRDTGIPLTRDLGGTEASQDKPTEIVNSIGMRLRRLPPGIFRMGDENEYETTAYPDHLVQISKSFFLGVYAVTQNEYQLVMGHNPSYLMQGCRHPVEEVSWEEAVEFCSRLSALPEEKEAGRLYRLPTEAEWECACRAGTTTSYPFGNDMTDLKNHAWFLLNSGGETHPVGQKHPNRWGLYDMLGNTWEWCDDWYGEYPREFVVDPKGPACGDRRVRRGGAWYLEPEFCTPYFRAGANPRKPYDSTGLRVAMHISGSYE